MARESTVDFGDMGLTQAQDRDVRAVLDQWDAQQRRLDFINTQHAAKEVGMTRTFTDSESGVGGEVKMRIPPWLYHNCGQHYGYKCWEDADFCKQVMKHYPECRVTSRSLQQTIVVPDIGTVLAAKPKRFVKTYEAKHQTPNTKHQGETPCAP